MGKLTAPRIEPSEIHLVTMTDSRNSAKAMPEYAPVEKREHDRADEHALAALEAEVQREHMAEDDEDACRQLADRTGEHHADRDRRRALGDVAEKHEQRLFSRPWCGMRWSGPHFRFRSF